MTQTDQMPELEPIIKEEEIDAILEAISSLNADDVFEMGAADDLDELSSGTIFDGIEAGPEGLFRRRGTNEFEAAATVYVTLQYGGRRDGVSMADSFPALVVGHLETSGTAVVESVSVNTDKFYGPDED